MISLFSLLYCNLDNIAGLFVDFCSDVFADADDVAGGAVGIFDAHVD